MSLSEPSLSATHYENDPAFFEAFLDPYIKYGPGYFTGDEPFEVAAVRMLDRILDSARLPLQGGTVLDVGSGWGPLRRRLRERAPGLRYHHVNPSSKQRAFIEERFGKADAEFCGTAEQAELPAKTYAAIFVSDALCHIRDRRSVLAKLRRALAPGGRILLQDTFFLSDELYAQHKSAASTRFVQEDVFGFADIPSVETFAREWAEAGLRLTAAEDVSSHYVRTVAAWLRRLERLDPRRFELRDACIRYLKMGAAGLDYTTCEMFMVLTARERSRAQLKANLSVLSREEV